MNIAKLTFEGRVVAVTGGGRGIGRALALELGRRGAAVVVNDLGADVHGGGVMAAPANDVAAEIVAAGGTAVAVVESVATDAGASAIVEAAVLRFGRLDAVVNNAGILDRARFPEVDLQEFKRQLAVHAGGSFAVTRAAWPHLVTSGAGRVVMTTSPAGLYGSSTETAYGAAKAALVGLTRSLAVVGRSTGIKVNAIAPGAYSRMTESGVASGRFKEFTATHRTAEAIAPLVAVLSHELCPATGEIFSVSGGRVARVLIAETPGFVEPGHSAEKILEHWAEVVDEHGYSVPNDTAEYLAIGLERLRSGGVEVPEVDLGNFTHRDTERRA